MGKKKTFADKVKKAAGKQDKPPVEYVKWVKAYRTEDGSWKFRTVNIAVTDENKSEIYG
jgi:hypothetical protein